MELTWSDVAPTEPGMYLFVGSCYSKPLRELGRQASVEVVRVAAPNQVGRGVSYLGKDIYYQPPLGLWAPLSAVLAQIEGQVGLLLLEYAARVEVPAMLKGQFSYGALERDIPKALCYSLPDEEKQEITTKLLEKAIELGVIEKGKWGRYTTKDAP